MGTQEIETLATLPSLDQLRGQLIGLLQAPASQLARLMNELAAKGKVVLMISSELPEVIGMADRVLVMHEGRITGEIADGRLATQEQIMDLAVK